MLICCIILKGDEMKKNDKNGFLKFLERNGIWLILSILIIVFAYISGDFNSIKSDKSQTKYIPYGTF